MPDPIIADTPFGDTPAWPPSPARLDRELDAQNNFIINVDWSADRINLTTDVQGLLPLSNLASNTGPYLLGSTATGSPVRITIGSNMTLSGDTISAATSGGAGSGDFSTNTSTSVVNEVVLFSNTTGKQGKRSTGTGICRLTSGVLSVGSSITGNTEISGPIAATNMPALTGAVTNTAGTVATTISPLAVTNAMLAGGITASNLVGTDIASVGTIIAGSWAGTPIPIAYGGTGSSNVAAARAALGIQNNTTVGDVDYSVLPTDSTVTLNATLTAVRTWTLPQASTVNDGTTVRITTSVPGVSSTNYIQIAPFAGDTINGATTSFILNKAFGVIQFTKSSSTNWVLLSTTSVVRRVFTSNQTYTTPVGIKSLYAECVSGGGAGGGAALSSSNLSVGSGGSGGMYCAAYIGAPAASYLITIGTGGVGVSGAAGGSGSNTSFGAVCIANAGLGGNVIAPGTGAATLSGAGSPGGGTGDWFSIGGAGGPAIRLSGTSGISGAGGASGFYFGSMTQQAYPGSGPAPGGNTYGGGGAGALTTGAAAGGGNGAAGVCLVTEYY